MRWFALSSTAVFGKRKEPHTIIIAKGDRISHFTIRPWMAALAASVLAAVAVGYLLATSYLMLRDDILNAAIARQARMQHAYEDRIAALRSQVDRITSYRLLDQQIMETKVAELLTRQTALLQRSSRLEPVLEQARESGVSSPSTQFDPARVPIPAENDRAAELRRTLFEPQQPVRAEASAAPAAQAGADAADDDGTTPILALSRLGVSLEDLESDQLDRIGALTSSARAMRRQLVADARDAGLPLAAPEDDASGTGGPFIPVDGADGEGDGFDLELKALNHELDALDRVRGEVRAFPIANPAPGHRITSGFGPRRDPIIGKTAFHAGIDLGVKSGTPVYATGSGTVVRAGRNGGYGNMVEIRHVNGLKTRYAHLSRIFVKEGQKVAAGQKIAASGSTGRSTGPHLHYEVRDGKTAVNPMTWLKAGKRLRQYL